MSIRILGAHETSWEIWVSGKAVLTAASNGNSYVGSLNREGMSCVLHCVRKVSHSGYGHSSRDSGLTENPFIPSMGA